MQHTAHNSMMRLADENLGGFTHIYACQNDVVCAVYAFSGRKHGGVLKLTPQCTGDLTISKHPCPEADDGWRNAVVRVLEDDISTHGSIRVAYVKISLDGVEVGHTNTVLVSDAGGPLSLHLGFKCVCPQRALNETEKDAAVWRVSTS